MENSISLDFIHRKADHLCREANIIADLAQVIEHEKFESHFLSFLDN